MYDLCLFLVCTIVEGSFLVLEGRLSSARNAANWKKGRTSAAEHLKKNQKPLPLKLLYLSSSEEQYELWTLLLFAELPPCICNHLTF